MFVLFRLFGIIIDYGQVRTIKLNFKLTKMKKILFSSALAFSTFMFVNAQETPIAVENKNQAEIQFDVETHDFGTIKEGVMATHDFKCRNIGKEPLLISNVTASCGCTTPNWTKEPIMPNKTGMVTAVYNSSGRPGTFHKSITVNSNAKTAVKILTIKGNVEAKPVEIESPLINKSN
jgi:hypothetical protein